MMFNDLMDDAGYVSLHVVTTSAFQRELKYEKAIEYITTMGLPLCDAVVESIAEQMYVNPQQYVPGIHVTGKFVTVVMDASYITTREKLLAMNLVVQYLTKRVGSCDPVPD